MLGYQIVGEEGGGSSPIKQQMVEISYLPTSHINAETRGSSPFIPSSQPSNHVPLALSAECTSFLLIGLLFLYVVAVRVFPSICTQIHHMYH